MQFRALIAAVVPTLLSWQVRADSASSSTSTLKFDAQKPTFTFDYSTTVPDKTNWVAVYPKGYDPSVAEQRTQYLYWAYAPESSGTVQIQPAWAYPGEYSAWFLAQNGYNKLAGPVRALNRGETGPIEFIVSKFTTQNAREKERFTARVRGLVKNRLQPPRFTLLSDSSESGWVEVGSDGLISGTPAKGDRGTTTIVVGAIAENGSKTTLQVSVPVVAADAPMVDQLKVTTMNIWVGGAFVHNSHYKQVSYLASTNADVIGLQETVKPGDAGTRLAKALGYYHHDKGDKAILSRYPIVEALEANGAADGVHIQLDGEDSEIIFYTAHLGYDPYGPYDFCFSNMTAEQVTGREAESGRTGQIMDISAGIAQLMPDADRVPVFLTGDFNAPSQLDWTEATRDAHCGVGYYEWPTSKYPLAAGLKDTFRELHPDPAQDPADTWSPLHPASQEPPDRIDFMYYGGNGVKPLESFPNVVGTPKFEPDQWENEWPTDHKSFESLYQLLPSAQRKTRDQWSGR
ncbi:exonuclease III [Cordyceps fumosorosea ARSEF 2679]|uniref:Exonuclease III n=1 Tax=Cordyceps fumosorosea (strain ARSEF 2679) TaxID=1081104 RepID=A0A167R044_CORFA|nr:exonuclease III [Cordyceps fumosorosea ARSEF 2679]OAA58148.1 exonuclease III [Cordyceps fumosorosea ARSEF 2679]